MQLNPIRATAEVHAAPGGVEGHFLLGDVIEQLDALLPKWEGRVKCVYFDPPFTTGDRFYAKVRVGEADWKSGHGSLSIETFCDTMSREDYLQWMREVLIRCRALMREDGTIFVHIDYRISAHMRLLLDEVFGEDNFLNEIIWAYQTGGRSRRFFSRKHDTIYFYKKTDAYDFNVEAVMEVPETPRENHMRRHVDADGRVYRSIRSNGKVYTYYDDDPIAPTDVWQGLNPPQQKDPERTGYDTQKPLSLLNRIVKCASREGEWVLDPFAGSGTTLEAAKLNGRPFIGIDRCPITADIARRRLNGARYTLHLPETDAPKACSAEISDGVGFYIIRMTDYEGGFDRVDSWSVGYMTDGVYRCMAEFLRTRKTPAFEQELSLPAYTGQKAVCVCDVDGTTSFYELPEA